MRIIGMSDRITVRLARRILTGFVPLIVIGVLSSSVLHAQTYTVLYNFTYLHGDGKEPFAPPVSDANGNLYGTTTYGGNGISYGTVYKIDASGIETVLHSFNDTDGGAPGGRLIFDASGNIYGTTFSGGPSNAGEVFKIDTSGNFSVVYSFSGPDGRLPDGDIVFDTAGNLYGTTQGGGAADLGTVFKIDTAGNETVLHSFTSSEGIYPTSGLVIDSAGNSYGTAFNGGAANLGMVFRIDPAGHYSDLHSFTGADGAYPTSGLVRDTAGNLYGTTDQGGTSNIGVAFKLDSAGNYSVLHNFSNADGYNPNANLVRDAAGTLYGTTRTGGQNSQGTIFKLDSAGNYTVLHNFLNNTTTKDGYLPAAGLSMDAAGNLYGTTVLGGTTNVVCTDGCGTVFKLTLPALLNNFSTEIVQNKFLRQTTIFGQFTPSNRIDLSSQDVSFSLAGAGNLSWTFPAGSFKRSIAGYFATTTNGSKRIALALTPLKNGSWGYSAAIANYLPGSSALTVALTIGNQSGSAQ